MAKRKKKSTFKKQKINTRRAKSKGPSPTALRGVRKPKKKRAPRAVPPPPRELGLLDAIGEVMADVEELGQEMRDWADNMPENKQGGDKHSEVEGAADTLEEQAGNDPVTPEMSFLNEVKFTWQDPTPKRRGYSRGARLGHAVDLLNEVIVRLEEYIGDKTGPNETTAQEVKDALEEIESELQGVEFPGMYG